MKKGILDLNHQRIRDKNHIWNFHSWRQLGIDVQRHPHEIREPKPNCQTIQSLYKKQGKDGAREKDEEMALHYNITQIIQCVSSKYAPPNTSTEAFCCW